ncbi:MAG: hypothetical protein ACLR07_03905 [Christensenellales bacterium]
MGEMLRYLLVAALFVIVEVIAVGKRRRSARLPSCMNRSAPRRQKRPRSRRMRRPANARGVRAGGRSGRV